MRDHLVFYVNDRRYEIGDSRAEWTLAEFLRQSCRLVGTKVVCAEGDCGSCTVLVGRERPGDDQLHYQPVDSCIVFLFQLDRTHVVTVEGMSRDEDELSVVQEAMIAGHGSQCGFCTPGFVAALHGMVEQHQEVAWPEASFHEPQLRLGLSGNLCRCTGYLQILEAGKQISPAAVHRMADRYDPQPMLADFRQLPDEPIHLRAAEMELQAATEVFLPNTLVDAVEYKARHPAARVVAGATDVGVLRNHGRLKPAPVLALNRLDAAFRQVKIHADDGMYLGAGATWTQVLETLGDRLPEFTKILLRFGSPQIRNLATVGGNLVNASPIADSLPLFYVLDAQLELISPRGTRSVPVDKFYRGYKQLDLEADELLSGIRMKLPGQAEHLKLYKVAKRRDLDISTVTLGIWFRIEDELITAARFAAGGVAPTVRRLAQAESHACGLPCSEQTFRGAGRIARTEVRPITDVRAGAEYRLQLVENLFWKAWFDL